MSLNVVPIQQPIEGHLPILTFDNDRNIAELFGMEEPMKFESDTWNLLSHPGLRATGKVGNFEFDKIPERFKVLAKMLVVARLNPGAVASLGDITERAIKHCFGNDARFGNPSTAFADFGMLLRTLSVLEAEGLLDSEIKSKSEWDHVVAILHRPFGEDIAGREAESLTPATVKNRIRSIVLLDSLARKLSTTEDFRESGLWGSVPFLRVSPSRLVPGEDFTDELNRVPPNADVFLVAGFSDWMIRTVGDDLLSVVNQFSAIENENRQRRKGDRRKIVTPDWWGDQEVNGETLIKMVTELKWACYFACMTALAMRPQDIVNLDRECIRTEAQIGDGEGGGIRAWRAKGISTPVETFYADVVLATRAINMMNAIHLAEGTAVSDSPVIKHIPKKRHLLFHNRRGGIMDSSRVVGNGNGLSFLKRAARRYQELFDEINDNLDDVNITAREVRVTALCHYADRESGVALAAAFCKHGSIGSVLGGYIGFIEPKLAVTDQRLVAINTGRGQDGIPLEETDIPIVDEIERRAAAGHLTQAMRLNDQQQQTGEKLLGGHGLGKMATQLSNPDLDGIFEELQNNRPRLGHVKPLSRQEIKLVGDLNANVSTSPMTICLFDKGDAKCGGAGSADFRQCQPFHCGNSVMRPGHRALAEIRRRTAMLVQDKRLFARNVEALGEHAIEIAEEFKGYSNRELIDLYLKECDDALALLVAGWDDETEPWKEDTNV